MSSPDLIYLGLSGIPLGGGKAYVENTFICSSMNKPCQIFVKFGDLVQELFTKRRHASMNFIKIGFVYFI
jgi:hypothetical protein